MSQRALTSYRPPTASVLPSRPKAIVVSRPWAGSATMLRKAGAPRSAIDQSSNSDPSPTFTASVRPSGLNTSRPVRPGIVLIRRGRAGSAASHSDTGPCSGAVATVLPSGLTATAVSAWPEGRWPAALGRAGSVRSYSRLGSPATAIRPPCLAVATMPVGRWARARGSAGAFTFHRVVTPVSSPVAICVPAGLNATAPSRPAVLKVVRLTGVAGATSHRTAAWSCPALATVVPSGEYAKE
ncbi:hypothetical protein ACFQQB_54240 [Nonomuraea rubra]|uniref:hypothetical protein n=1 Tax=Nonomuraea rubra TaxID=46180 RepID=UPI003610F061